MLQKVSKLAALMAVATVMTSTSSLFGQVNSSQTFTVTVGSDLSVTPPSGGNAILAPDQTDSNQDFAAGGTDVDWHVLSNSGNGATISFANDGLFTNTIGPNFYTRNLYFEIVETSVPSGVWAVSGSPNFTSSSLSPTATLQSTSTGQGNASFAVNARFIDNNYSLLPAGTYVMTITGTVSANP